VISRDPLERAFELLKADSTGLADNPNLENKLMNELQRQNRPSRFKKLALVVAVLVGLVLATGGIAMAAGFNPIELFITIHGDGSTEIYYQNGVPANAKIEVQQTEDGYVEATVTVPNSQGEVQLRFPPNESATVITSQQPDKDAKPIPPAPAGPKK
jgi:hypothetical protein